jgi:putative ABC transport system ATP-binding protein
MDYCLIRLEGVEKVYDLGSVKIEALRGLNLSIEKGDFLAIKGSSGSGKSTAMHLMGTLDRASGGRIYLEGDDINKFDESKLAEIRGKRIGFVFQNFNLIPNLSALDNVALPMIFQGKSRKESREVAKRLLERVGLGHRLRHKPSELSGGERQRVAIARALVNDPDIVLADEPTGNLDSKTGKEIIRILKELNKEGKTVVMITHDDKIAKEAKKIVNMKDGRILK